MSNNKREPQYAAAFAARPAKKPAARPAHRLIQHNNGNTAEALTAKTVSGTAVFLKGGRKCFLSRRSTACGGEGEIYIIENDRSYCCKIFTKSLTPEQTERLADAIQMFRRLGMENPEANKFICPPEEIVYSHNKPVGYLMRYIPGKPLAFYTSFEANFIPDYCQTDQLFLCEQTAFVTGMLHSAGIVIGDLHPSNIMVCQNGSIVFVDLNGAGFCTGNKHYEAVSLHSEMRSPEHIANGAALTKADDLWSLENIIFRIMLPSLEPYNYKCCKEVEKDISEGNYYFYDERRIVSPEAAALYHALPLRLKWYFMHCFHHNGDYFKQEKRPDAFSVMRMLRQCRKH